MRNNKGIILSTYIYVLLMFFLFLLVAMLTILNNTKLISTKMKEGVNTITKAGEDSFSIILLGEGSIQTFKGIAYVDAGYIAQTKGGESITATITTNIDTTVVGNYTYTYKIMYNGLSKTVTRNIAVIDTTYSFNYLGLEQIFTAPVSGYYKLETWGAQGGQASATYYGGYGAYSTGAVYLEKNKTIYIYVGGQGQSGCVTSACAGGYNGGGNAGYTSTDTSNYQSGGGGATHISLVSGILSTQSTGNILIAASGGGGGYYHTGGVNYSMIGASGGGISGTNGTVCVYGVVAGGGGTQSAGGTAGYRGSAGSFGAGGYGINSGTTNGGASGGGGGYYGGGAAGHSGSGGGSGYIANPLLISYGSALKSMSCYNCTESPAYTTKTVSTTNVSATATSSYAKSGNGYAKITFLSNAPQTRTNTKLNNVRYIKDCVNGSSTNTSNHWVELQAIYNGTNIAYGKTVTGTGTENTSFPFTNIVNGDITSANYGEITDKGLQCITVNLGSTYNLDEISVWHYFADGRTYYSNTTYVSSDNSTWTPVMASTTAETSQGKKVSAYDANTTVTPVYRVSNLVTNGSFENGTTGWSTYNFTMSTSTTYKKHGSYSMPIVTTSASHAQISQSVPIIAGNKYYGRVSLLKAATLDNSGQYDILNFTSGEMDFATSNNTTIPNTSQWYDISNIINGIETKNADLRKYTFSKVPVYTDAYILIDLTSTFGVGKEPTKAWCDANLNYFDGSQNLNLSP